MPTRILVVDDSPTIRTVVSTILERHGYDPKVASDGQDAYDALASGEVEVDLVLVDFVMPHMDGHQFCRALRENPDLTSMPVVLMSAKADRIRDEFVEQTGALDALTKPFDAQALVAVVENALKRVHATNRASSSRRLDDYGGPRARSSRSLVDSETDSNGADASIPLPLVEVELAARRSEATRIVAQKLAGIVARTVAHRPEVVASNALADAVAERLSNEAIHEMVETIVDLQQAKAVPILAGDLGGVPVGAILQLLQSEMQTGILVCSHDRTEVRATFRNGHIDLVEASGASDEFRLGRFFVEEGLLTSEEIEKVVHSSSPSPPRASDADHAASIEETPRSSVHPIGPSSPVEAPTPLGMALVAAGKVSESQLRLALTRQSSELLYEVLRWPAGRFELRREEPSELAANARLGLPVASVVMEGFRRVDEWRVLERMLGSFDAVLLRDHTALDTLDISSLPMRERAVLDAVDGERTVRGIVEASRLSSFEACRILVQFLHARALRRRVA